MYKIHSKIVMGRMKFPHISSEKRQRKSKSNGGASRTSSIVDDNFFRARQGEEASRNCDSFSEL
jgi:hypothetical protein